MAAGLSGQNVGCGTIVNFCRNPWLTTAQMLTADRKKSHTAKSKKPLGMTITCLSLSCHGYWTFVQSGMEMLASKNSITPQPIPSCTTVIMSAWTKMVERLGLIEWVCWKTGSRSRHTSKYLAKGRIRHILRPVSIKQVHEDVMAFWFYVIILNQDRCLGVLN